MTSLVRNDPFSHFYTQWRLSKHLTVTLKVKQSPQGDEQLVVKGYSPAHVLIIPGRRFSAQELELGGKTITEVIETGKMLQLFRHVLTHHPALGQSVTTSEPDLLAECTQDLDHLIEITRQALPNQDQYRFVGDDQALAASYRTAASASKSSRAYPGAMGNYEFAFQCTQEPTFYIEFLSLIEEIQHSEKAADFKFLKEKATLLRFSLIRSQIENKQIQEAINTLEKMPEAEKTYEHALLLILLYIQEKKFEKAKTLAAKTAEASARQNPQKAHILYKAACEALEREEHEFALHLCKIAECLQQPPRWIDQLIQMDVWRRQRNHSALKDKLQTLTQTLPFSEKLKAYKMLIQLEKTAKNYSAILDIYAKKEHPRPVKQRAWQMAYLSFLQERGSWFEAEPIAEEIVRNSPEAIEPLKSLKEIYIQLKRNDKLSGVYKNLSQLLQKRNDYAQAVAICEEALKQFPTELDFQKTLSSVLVQWAEELQQRGQTAESVRNLFRAIELARAFRRPPEEVLAKIEKIREIDPEMEFLGNERRNYLLLHEMVVNTLSQHQKQFQQAQQKIQTQIKALEGRIVRLEAARIPANLGVVADKRRVSPTGEAQRIDKKSRHEAEMAILERGRPTLLVSEGQRPPKQPRPSDPLVVTPAAAAAASEERALSPVDPSKDPSQSFPAHDRDDDTTTSVDGAATALVNLRHVGSGPAYLPSLPEIAIGKRIWEKFFLGDIGNEPPLPPDINEILNAPCPFSKGQKVRDTHMLVLIPKTFNGKDLTISHFGALITKPREGGHPAKYDKLCDFGRLYDNEYQSHWVLMTKTALSEGSGASLAEQTAIVKKYNYEFPHVLTGVICILMHHVLSGECLYPYEKDKDLLHYIRCWGLDSLRIPFYLSVGGFNEMTGLQIKTNFREFDLSIAALRKL